VTGLHLHIDCPSGIAGDMFVGAALDLGVPREVIDRAIAALGLPIRWTLTREARGGIVGQKVRVVDEHGRAVDAHPHTHEFEHAHKGHHVHPPASAAHDPHHDPQHPHRHYREIRALLDRLPPRIGERAVAIFDRIAEVEGRLHGVPPADVAFHEVGALDSIFDVVAAAAALDWLAPVRTTCARVPLGTGSVRAAHGQLPVPAPATAALLVGAPVDSGPAPFELTTPTGAAILAATVDAWQELPALTLRAIGYGAGERELSDRPNLLRLLLGEPRTAAEAQEVTLVEANVDDMAPSLAEPLMEALFHAGAVDVWFTPIQMKKNRPAFQVSALAPLSAQAQVTAAFLRESSTLGVRHQVLTRTTLDRRTEQVSTPFGPVDVKLGLQGDRVVNLAPEYESVRRLAAEKKVPVKEVYAAALAAAATLRRQTP